MSGVWRHSLNICWKNDWRNNWKDTKEIKSSFRRARLGKLGRTHGVKNKSLLLRKRKHPQTPVSSLLNIQGATSQSSHSSGCRPPLHKSWRRLWSSKLWLSTQNDLNPFQKQASLDSFQSETGQCPAGVDRSSRVFAPSLKVTEERGASCQVYLQGNIVTAVPGHPEAVWGRVEKMQCVSHRGAPDSFLTQ